MTATDGYFADQFGRRLLLHGVNLSGSSKVPVTPSGATHLPESLLEHRKVSFVGRPFALSEADDHFARLHSWGFSIIRLLVTWEAVEHSGPGIYDREYLDFLAEIVKRAGTHGLQVLIDFHQDAWSRFSGGAGAPGWTLEAAGMALRHVDETGAAVTHQGHEGPYEKMIWSTNGQKLAAATMFTLFFGGNDFAPRMRVDGRPIQDFLQEHYLQALRTIAARLADLENLVGYDPMNEPLPGYIGCADLEKPVGEPRIGALPTPLQSMALGSGLPQEVEVWRFGFSGSRRRGRRLLNPRRLSLWPNAAGCPWQHHGVWEPGPDGSPRVIAKDYFSRIGGHEVDFDRDYYAPFLVKCARTLRAACREPLLFLEPSQGARHVAPCPGGAGIAAAPHWYDGPLLMLKRYSPYLGADSLRRRVVLGRRRIRQSYRNQVCRLKQLGIEALNGAPTLIGETGVPFDLKVLGDGQRRQEVASTRAMERTLRAMDDALASYAIWNYTPDNTQEHGDQWNEENLSIFNAKRGGRALPAVVRPYARAIAGRPVRMSFERRRRRFFFEFEHDPAVTAPTEIFVPEYHYPTGVSVRLSDGRHEVVPSEQLVRYRHGDERARHWIEIGPSHG